MCFVFFLQIIQPGYSKCEDVPVSLSTLSLSSCARVTSEYFLAGVDVHGRCRTREEREISSDLNPLTANCFFQVFIYNSKQRVAVGDISNFFVMFYSILRYYSHYWDWVGPIVDMF